MNSFSINEAGLDRPVWAALSTQQAELGHGNALARRYHPEVSPFAAVANETPAAWDALRQLLQPQDQVATVSLEPVGAIDGLQTTHAGMVDQMIATERSAGGEGGQDILPLGQADVKDMLDLVQKTKPGPFARRTIEMGRYIGLRDGGRLIAMAGERMRFDGHVELSAVCVDDGWRGKGLAVRLLGILRAEIEARGATPFLHVFSDNHHAIALYERLGFVRRRTFFLTRIGHADADADADAGAASVRPG